MTVVRYSRWDGSQVEFSLDSDAALDALSDLMMEGMTASEAMEWMREHGFELAGLNMRVMGVQDLIRELRDQARELYERYDMSQATDDLAQRLEDILDREEQAQRAQHGYESARMNDFLARRHGAGPDDPGSLSEAIERFRDHEFEDEDARDDFRDLLEELDSLQALEDFLEEEADRFRGDETADYETAQEIRERLESMESMARDLAAGNLEGISPEQLSEMLGDQASQSLILLRDLQPSLERAGYLRGDDEESLTPRAIRKIGAHALADVYNALRKGLRGTHDTKARGTASPRPDEVRAWEFGDPLELDVVGTVMNGIKRHISAGDWSGSVLPLEVDDFQVHEFDYSTQTTTVLLLDMSWSMSWAGRFPAAKRVALAMDQLVRTSFPRDHFAVVGFSTVARELSIRELPEVSWDMGDPFTNLQSGLQIAEDVIRRFPSASPQILVITDGQPTAYYEEGELRVEWPSGFGGVSPHAVAETLKAVHRITKMGVTINTFMLDDAPELVGFVERMTQINRGRAFYTQPTQLGSFLMVDYISRRKVRRGA